MTLREFLNEFDFDYEKDENGNYKLIDLQRVNLGGIEQEEFSSIPEIVNRLDTYYGDYIYRTISEADLMGVDTPIYEGEEEYNAEMVEWLKENYGDNHYLTKLVECIANPELIKEDR